MRRASRIVLTASLLATAACDESFAPLDPIDRQFSVYGYLDVSADTQWIRVMPIRFQITSPPSRSARVTLENLGNGRVIELRDSLFRFDTGAEVGSEGVYVHNHWTTEPIEPGATYRFRAQAEELQPAEAVIPVPERFRIEVWHARPEGREPNILRLRSLRHLAFLVLVMGWADSCGGGEPVVTDLGRGSPETDDQMIPFRLNLPNRVGCTNATVTWVQLWIVGSGEEWPAGAKFQTGRLNVPEIPSNISNSLGFLGGVLTRTFELENCTLEGPPEVNEHCRLRYDDEDVVTLRGRIMDLRCEGEPVISATVRLRELEPDENGLRRVRTARTGFGGNYEIRALEPGRRYEVHVARSRGLLEPPLPVPYGEHTDTLELAAGGVTRYDARLERFGPC